MGHQDLPVTVRLLQNGFLPSGSSDASPALLSRLGSLSGAGCPAYTLRLNCWTRFWRRTARPGQLELRRTDDRAPRLRSRIDSPCHAVAFTAFHVEFSDTAAFVGRVVYE